MFISIDFLTDHVIKYYLFMYIPGYYKRNRHFQCCIEKKLLMI